MKDRLIKLFGGVTLASFGIACVLNSDLGTFSVTLAYKGIANWLNIPLAIINIVLELSMLLIAMKISDEGIGWTAIVNATYGAIMINIFHNILPHTTILWLGGFLLPIGWSLMGKARYGDSGTNILMRAIMKRFNQNILIARFIIDFAFLVIAWIFLPNMITWFTIFLTFGASGLLKVVYKLVGYKPTKIEHNFIIESRN